MVDVEKIKTIQKGATLLHSEEEINNALDHMAGEITQKLQDQNPLVLCVMIGAMIPTAHLLTRLHFPLQVDYIHATRYHGKTRSGDLHWLVEPRISVKDRTVLIVEDILDGGLTIAAIKDYCEKEGAKAVYTAVSVNKKRVRDQGGLEKADFSGIDVDDLFLFGFGLDYEGYYRNVPGIYAVTEAID